METLTSYAGSHLGECGINCVTQARRNRNRKETKTGISVRRRLVNATNRMLSNPRDYFSHPIGSSPLQFLILPEVSSSGYPASKHPFPPYPTYDSGKEPFSSLTHPTYDSENADPRRDNRRPPRSCESVVHGRQRQHRLRRSLPMAEIRPGRLPAPPGRGHRAFIPRRAGALPRCGGRHRAETGCGVGILDTERQLRRSEENSGA